MLHSGFVEMGTLHETNEGTPQGGVISPALCNLVVRQVLDILHSVTILAFEKD
jgi:RNA-directed DNA polymerase